MDEVKPFNVKATIRSQEAEPATSAAEGPKQDDASSYDADLTAYGQKLAQAMEQSEVHPVLIFGSANSGKSVMLASLLSFLRNNNLGLSATLISPLLESDSGVAKEVEINAQQFFNHSVINFGDGQAPLATRSRLPFFIPIEAACQSPASGGSVRVALMESNGESYHPDSKSPRFYSPLTPDVRAFLSVYEHSISVIYVAPVTQAAVRDGTASDARRDRADRRIAEHAIVGAIGAYKATRPEKPIDHHLLLASKWDAYGSADKSGWTLDRILNDSTAADDVVPFLQNYYKEALTSFNTKLQSARCSIHQYCAGVMNARDLDRGRNQRLRPLLDCYSFDLWNWIHTNASGRSLTPPLQSRQTLQERLDAFIARIRN